MRRLYLTLFFLICLSSVSLAQSNQVPDNIELAALKELYDSTAGPSWTIKTNWPTPGNWPASATSAQFGTWFGITVFNGDITSINLNGNNLTGHLPSSLGNLTALKFISIVGGHLTGNIPSSIWNLTQLQSINLGGNQLTGSLPGQFNLPHLTGLIFTNNKLSGKLPASLGSLTTLQILQLDGNQFTGGIPPVLANLSDMRSLYLSNNPLGGTIPDIFGQMTRMTSLRLAFNQLTGPLPPSLGAATTLTSLVLTSNNLSGSIPSTWSTLTNLTEFSLNVNQLSGELPSFIGTWTKLASLDLHSNKFTGVLPSNIGNCTNLTTISLSDNQFTGPIPSGIGSTALTFLNCSNNYFTSLPASLLSRPALTIVYFDNNELTSVPDFSNYGNKANLVLRLQNNRLDFSQLEPVATGFKATSGYVPQKNISDDPARVMTIGSSLVITARPVGANTSLTWEKQNSSGGWAAVTNDQDAAMQTFTRNVATAADGGVYRWKTTSTTTGFSGITIMSDPITVKTATGFTLDNWAFQYKYDGRKRMTCKKVPGADWVYMVYDNRDRLVMTQDGNQRLTNQWTYTIYDQLNRPIMTGLYNHLSLLDQAGMNALIDTNNFFETFNGTKDYYGYTTGNVMPSSRFNGTFEPLTITYYDSYSFVNGDPHFAYRGTSLTNQYQYTPGGHDPFPNVTGQVTGTWTKTLPKDRQWIRTVNYYDDKQRVVQTITDNHKRGQDIITNVYDFTGKVLASKTESIDHHLTWSIVHPQIVVLEDRVVGAGTSAIPWAFSSQQVVGDGWLEYTVSPITTLGTTRTLGFSTSTTATNVGWGVRVDIGNNTAFTLVMENGVSKGSPVTVFAGDVMRVGRRGTTMRYSRNGVVFFTTTLTSIPVLYPHALVNQPSATIFNPMISIEGPKRSVERHFEYDHAGRLLKTWHSTDNADSLLLVNNEYNELGQLIDKKLHSTDNNSFRQSLDYRYNIRGWLTSINGAQLTSDASKNPDASQRKDLFGMDLHYNDVVTGLGNSALFNGNISAMEWSNNLGLSATKERAYRFDYDPMNRLTSATQKTFNGIWTSSSAYHESGVTYDLNGNIKTLLRGDENGALMDSLKYGYGTGNQLSNMLHKVTDTGTDHGFTDVPGIIDDYAYDPNGNLTMDKNKSITSITYNHLNLPVKVLKSTGENVVYNYDATGRKLSQDVFNAQGVLKKRSDYRGEWFYENDTLKFLNHEEGRVTMAAPQESCIPCNVLSDRMKDYVTQYGLQNLANLTQLTSYLNTALGASYSSTEYQASIQHCHVLDAYMNFAGGSNGYVSFGQPSQYNMGTGDFTVEAWFNYPNGINTGVYPIVTNQDFAGGAFSGMNLCLFQQKVYFILGDGTAGGATTAVFANSTPLFTVWHHVVAQRIGNTPGNFKIYLDGVEVAKTVASSQFTTGDLEHTAVRDMKIGSRSGSIDNNAFQGSIKQVRIYKRILTATEIASNFNNGYFLGPTDVTQMVLWAPLNEGTGTQVKDYSTFNQQGNLVGSNVTWTNNYLPQQSALCPAYQEYQYHLKDHLGNVRMTFTTKDEVDSSTATLEASHVSDDRSNFLNYDDARLVYSQLFDHTNGGSPGYAQRLSGSLNEKIGLAKSLSVMPGDVINAEVYAKYFDPNAPNLAVALQALLSSLANPAGSGGTVIDGTGYSSASTLTTPWGAGTGTQSDQTVPKAFLNYLYINRNYDPASMRFKYKPISIAALEDGTDRLHELLSITDEISEAGYVYIYLSNDGEAVREVYFDDFKVEQVKSPVIQSQDYFPFGLSFNEYERENSTKNKYLFNQGTGDNTFKTERVVELDLNVDQSLYRTYDFITGRWWQVDPKGDAGGQESWSTYQFGFDNPIRYNDPKGDCPPIICGAVAGAIIGAAAGAIVATIEGKTGSEIAAAAGAGLVSGAIIGSGVGLLTGAAAGTGTVVATSLARTGANVAITNAAVGFVAGAAEETVTQGIEGQQGRRQDVDTGKIVRSALVGSASNAIAGPAGKMIVNKLTNTALKAGATSTVAAKVQTATEVATEAVVNKVSNVVKDKMAPATNTDNTNSDPNKKTSNNK